MELAYFSKGEGPLLLLLHPVGLDKGFWGGAAELLAQKFTVLAVDLPGHGDSPDSGRYSRISDYVADVAGAIKAQQKGPAILVGSSFGGMLTQQLALEHPELVSRLVICASPGLVTPEVAQVAKARARQALSQGMASLLSDTLDRWFTKEFAASATVQKVRARLLSNKPENWAAAWMAIAGHDAQPRLGKVLLPALVISASEDASTSVGTEIQLAKALPNSRLVVLLNAPHIMQLECPSGFQRVLSDYLMHDWWFEG